MMLVGKRCDFNLADPVNRMMIMWESGCFLVRSYDFNLGKNMMVIWDATLSSQFPIFSTLKPGVSEFEVTPLRL